VAGEFDQAVVDRLTGEVVVDTAPRADDVERHHLNLQACVRHSVEVIVRRPSAMHAARHP
jgi:hypothetical protein